MNKLKKRRLISLDEHRQKYIQELEGIEDSVIQVALDKVSEIFSIPSREAFQHCKS